MLALYISAGVIVLLFLALVFWRLTWDFRLNRFQKRNKVEPSKKQKISLRTNIAAFNLLLVVGILTIIGGVTVGKHSIKSPTFKPYEKEDITYKNAKTFDNQKEFEKLLKDTYSNSKERNNMWDGSKDTAIPEASMKPSGENNSNISDTYNQVEGISESDIVKISPDGKAIYYGPSFSNLIYKLNLDSSGNYLDEFEKLEFENFVFVDMLLSDNYLIIIGNETQYDMHPSINFSEFYYFWSYSSSVYKLIDLDTFTVVHEGEVEGSIKELRLVGNILYILSIRDIFFRDDKPIDLPSFENLYYFNGTSNVYNITKLTTINLKTFEENSIGFMGYNNAFYMGHNYIILVNTKWVFSSNWSSYYNTSSVVAISYNDKGELNYVGSTEVEGVVINQYSIDDFEGYIRLVTTFGKNHKNSVYVLRAKTKTDELEVVGLLDKGIGKPGEDVKSASFSGNILKVVTFRQIDPLYTIDLSNPTKPVIISEVEEPGYSSGLVIWDKDGNTIGIGYMASLEGRVIGYKVSAYKAGDTEPTQTIEFSYEEYGYISVPATYNQRQNLLVNKEAGLFGFMIYDIGSYQNSYSIAMLLKVDFSQEKPLIPTPLATMHLDNKIEKMVLVNDTVHLLSPSEGMAYSFELEEVVKRFNLK